MPWSYIRPTQGEGRRFYAVFGPSGLIPSVPGNGRWLSSTAHAKTVQREERASPIAGFGAFTTQTSFPLALFACADFRMTLFEPVVGMLVSAQIQ
jgi:hypothetical protein